MNIEKFLFFLFYDYLLRKREDIDFLVLYPHTSLNKDLGLDVFNIAGIIANFSYNLFEYFKFKQNYKYVPDFNLENFFDINNFMLNEEKLKIFYEKIKKGEEISINDLILLFKESFNYVLKNNNLLFEEENSDKLIPK